jgi:hypothetical protein
MMMYERWLASYLLGSDEVTFRFDVSPSPLKIPRPEIAQVPSTTGIKNLASRYAVLVDEVKKSAEQQMKQMRFVDIIPRDEFEKLDPEFTLELVTHPHAKESLP